MRQLYNRIVNMIARGTVSQANSAGKLQTLQIPLLANETKDGIEHFEPFGLTGNPPVDAEALVVFLEGDRSHGIAIAATDRRVRPKNLAVGDVALYNAAGVVIKITGTTVQITGATTVNVTGGDITADGISLKNHVHGGVQGGYSNTGAPH